MTELEKIMEKLDGCQGQHWHWDRFTPAEIDALLCELVPGYKSRSDA